ncbi:hypothetical protein AWM68_02450 [Fictibacillus phosphorivorans]|uniref:Uncharacterized protein n=1 Tax=Fictibacillus phosphorivorans TaxID=1221500 RepID=A0A163SI39_9BACL|nr:hypothetical protein [Fictibacillus phosphorivorans]KZE69148.1 hypothetical protein AWM68_02450 [Fictibacillus phosphorivorans]
MESKNSYITFGAQMGDANADQAVGPHLEELNLLLDRYCKKSYCKELNELALILRVDGELWHFGIEGCDKLRLSKKQGYITMDIGMPESKWKNQMPNSIRDFLISHLVLSLELMIKRLKKELFAVNEAELWADISRVKERFLVS